MPISDATRDEAQLLTRRYPVARSALLPMLHLVQSDEGFVSDDGIAMCAEVLGLTKAEVGSVATFYTMYKREPFGDYLLSVCTNPTCKIVGAQDIYESYVQACGGHVDREAGVMVEHAECLGICDAAPVVQINYEMYGPVTKDEAMDLLAKAKAGDPPASNRSGEVPATIRQVHREFSGIDDGVNDQLIEAAALQSAAPVAPAWRSGETDIPVSHPGGDPVGHGGQRFRSDANLSVTAQTDQTPERTGPQGDDEVVREVAASSSDASGELAEQVTSAPVDEAPAVDEQPTSGGAATPPESEGRSAEGSETDPQDSTAGEGGRDDLDQPVSERDTPSEDDSEPKGA